MVVVEISTISRAMATRVEPPMLRVLPMVMEPLVKIAVAIREAAHRIETKDKLRLRNETKQLPWIQPEIRLTTRALLSSTCSKCSRERHMLLRDKARSKITATTMPTTISSSSSNSSNSHTSSSSQVWTSITRNKASIIQQHGSSSSSNHMEEPQQPRLAQGLLVINSNSNSMRTTTTSSTMRDITTDRRIKHPLSIRVHNQGCQQQRLVQIQRLSLHLKETKRLETESKCARVGKSSDSDEKVSERMNASS